jgi:hypothetical protein
MGARYRKLVPQTLHYFSRPHEGPCDRPLQGPAAWRSADLDDSWRESLAADDVDALSAALAHARAAGKPLGALTASDFPLPTLATRIGRWRDELSHGRGFLVVRGVPVDRWSQTDAEIFFWCFGLHLGIPGAQNPQGDLLGHVRDERAAVDDVTIRAYRTRANIDFHCDLADVVGLLCLRGAKQGGRSRIVSSVTVFNELLEREPQLSQRLFEPVYFDTKSEGGLRYFPVAPCCYADGELRTFYHADYFREVERHPEVPPIDSQLRRLLDRYDALASDPALSLEMDFEPGDIQLLSNHTLMHGRSGYVDHDDPAERRHLLRLWLSLPHERSVKQRLLAARSLAVLLGNLALQRWRQRA